MEDSKITIRISKQLRNQIQTKVKTDLGLSLSAFTKFLYKSYIEDKLDLHLLNYEQQEDLEQYSQESTLSKIMNKKIF